MNTQHPAYTAHVTKDAYEDGRAAWTISFPDLPGCITFGDTIDAAVDMAADALALWLDDETERGAVPNPPRDFDELIAALTEAGEENISLIRITPRYHAPKTVRISMTVPADSLSLIDAAAEARGQNRSNFMTNAALQVINDGVAGE